MLEIDRGLADSIRCGDIEGFMRGARSRESYVPLAQGAIDLALSGITSLAEAMAVGSGLEEFIAPETPVVSEAPLSDAGVASLLEGLA
jgi:hypothetical protein